ncbi:MAG: hypothetical protein ACRD0X_05710 [Thermoanaerobaculia bacterium]
MPSRVRVLAVLVLALAALPAAGYTVYLKDGSTIDAEGPYVVDGERVLITLRSGTATEMPLAEIDVDKTRERNRGLLSDALVLQDGQLVDLETAKATQPKRETLAERIVRGQTTLSASPRATPGAPGAVSRASDAAPPPREQLQDGAAELLQRIFAGESVPGVSIYLGSAAGQPQIEVTTETEAGVFRGLLVAAFALQQAREERGEGLRAVELRFVTGQGKPAGDFVLTPELAAELTSSRIAPSEFYVQQVRF